MEFSKAKNRFGLHFFSMSAISIIIPTRNEEGNISYLLRRIDDTMRYANLSYEVIFIDDNSTDLTQSIIRKLYSTFPIRLYIKKGRIGKAQSLIEGFSHATSENIVMIDADLQYPPEKIPEMYKKIEEGYDIVIARRDEKHTSFFRTAASKSSLLVFGKLLHHLDTDVQSGLKMFKKEIVERLTLNPSPWSFDLEFLVKARDAGYTMTSIPVVFEERFSGKSKVNIIKTAWDIGSCALSLKFTKQEIIPFHKKKIIEKGQGFHYKGKEFIHFSNLSFSDSAFFRLTNMQKRVLIALLGIFIFFFFIDWHITLVAIFAALTILYFTDLLFNLFLIIQSFTKPSEINIKEEEISQRKLWPTYTIFCPLYKEDDVLTQFINAIEKLDYPKDKLQVILLLEEDDKITIDKAKTMSLPYFFSVAVTPHSFPKTKPKALNFGLQRASGEYCVVYDAEDIPDPLQLKKVVIAFEKSLKTVKCVQAKLNFYNPFQNILTRVFTAEYSLWFDLVLTGLQSIHGVIPLGGTSNHFRTEELRKLNGWDSFNVTEDCDLGLRLAKNGYQTAIVNSTTLEEANSDAFNWFNQRGRWIKGYMQTYLVHARNPNHFIKHAKLKQFFTFQLVIGGKIMSLFINPIMWAVTIIYFVFRPITGHFIESLFPGPILYMGVLCLIFGNFLYLYYYMIGCAKRQQFSLIKYAFAVPLYWLGMSLSGWHALYKIFTEPHYWAKTRHGLHLQKSQDKKPTFTIPSFKPQISM